MKALALLLVCCLQGDPLEELIEKLDDDDWRTRDRVSRQIFEMGPKTIPALERALDHPSPEVRSRAWTILQRFPEYRLRAARRLPGFPLVRDIWSAVIETAIGKKPVPRSVWDRVEPEESKRPLKEKETERREEVNPSPHSAGWMLRMMTECGAAILRRLAETYGVEESPVLRDMHRRMVRAYSRGRDLPRILIALRADITTFEEIYGTMRIMERMAESEELMELSGRDRVLFIDLLVHLRRRPGAPTMRIPRSKEQALRLVCDGPWVRGMAAALKRTLEEGLPRSERMRMLREKEVSSRTPLGELLAVYDALLDLDRALEHVIYGPALSRGTRKVEDVPCFPGCCMHWIEELTAKEAEAVRPLIRPLHGAQPGWLHEETTHRALLRAIVARSVLPKR